MLWLLLLLLLVVTSYFDPLFLYVCNIIFTLQFAVVFIVNTISIIVVIVNCCCCYSSCCDFPKSAIKSHIPWLTRKTKDGRLTCNRRFHFEPEEEESVDCRPWKMTAKCHCRYIFFLPECTSGYEKTPFRNFSGSRVVKTQTWRTQRWCKCGAWHCNTYCKCIPGIFLCSNCL